MAEARATDGRSFLTELPPRPGEHRIVVAVAAAALLAFLALVPVAALPIGRVEAFIPAYQAALAINDLVTAILLFGQFSVGRRRGVLWLANGYLFTAAMVVVHGLSFPDLVVPGSLIGGGSQTTAWLYMFWHAGLPLLVIAGALGDGVRLPQAGRAIAWSLLAVAAAVLALSQVATAGHDWLPPIMQGNRYTPLMLFVVGAVWALSVGGLAAAWTRRRRSVLDLWLVAVMAAWVADIGLSAVFNAARFDLGFYAGRIFGLFAASFVLVVLLLETRLLYTRLVRLAEAERERANRRAAALAQANRALRDSEARLQELNESLERRVAARTAELTAETLAREHAQEALRETQKLEAIGRIAGGIAHDFNNLLTVVQGNAGLLRRTLAGERDREAAESIHQAAERGARLIRQIMLFSRRQALNPEVIDLNARARDMSELLSRSLRGDIRLLVDLPAGLWPVECDATELDLALMNLCVNARDAMPGGGLVRLVAENRVIDADEAESLQIAGAFVALSVADTGSGIAPENLARVFEPYFTTKQAGEGTGLGLSQVYGFAQAAGGRALIASELGQGTRVTLYLPRAARAAGAAEPEAAALPSGGSGTVLLIEDDEAVAKVIVAMLQMIGYAAHHVRDARTALALLLGGQRFDLVFSDIMMPGGMSGLDLARRVRQHFPDLPILLASGYNRAAVEVDREGFSLLAKPFRADALADAVREAVTRHGRNSRSA
ncbi:MASE4 domain-containing protein [Desertibaculum subflavum]|uniref:MASE4 domain-containing protein n=1 Tax=Desertibaculum subflavum TaxID=2268458 RepID=UPI000E66FEB4